MKVLITGASGFTGYQIIHLLSHDKDIRIFGIARNPEHGAHEGTGVSWVQGDILDQEAIARAISHSRPDAIIHLAGANHGSLANLLTTNVVGTKNVLDAALAVNPACRILVVSSSAIYGYAGENPITEDQPLRPVTDYGISKAAQDHLCRMYSQTRGCQVAVARPFNLIGPAQPASFVCGKIVQQVIEIEQGKRSNLDLLEIQSCRDFIDVRDVVRAYRAIISHDNFEKECVGKAFNCGSGNAYPLSLVIDLLKEITDKELPVRLPASSPAISVPSQKSDNTRIHRITGWIPRISLKESLSDMLDVARKMIHS